MIGKKRLEKLIKQGAEIWKIEDGEVYPLRKDHYEYWRIKEDRLEWYWKIVPSGFNYISFEHLFETKEEAEWHKEFGCIERTERLELPTWEESKIDLYIEWFDDVEFKYFIHDDTYCLIKGYEIVLELKATKENYTLACRKAKELFLGENK